MIDKFYINHNYFISIDQLEDKNGCIAQFPKNIIYEPNIPEQKSTYIIEDNEVVMYHWAEGKTKERTIGVVEYVKRPLVIVDIVSTITSLKMSSDLITCRDRLGHEFTFAGCYNLLDIDLPEEERVKESKLTILLTDILVNNPSYAKAEEEGVLEGYELLVSHLESLGG